MLVLTSNNVFLPGEDGPTAASIEVDFRGKIVGIQRGKLVPSQLDQIVEVIDFGDLYLLPGLVDAHVHLNDPGRQDWEGFESGTKAAIAGGFTTIVDMPLNCIPPTTTTKNFEVKRKATRGKIFSDIAFWGGVIPGNSDDLIPMIRAGVKGFKCFLIDSGVEEFPQVTEKEVEEAMRVLSAASSVFLFHAEMDTDTEISPPNTPEEELELELDPTTYSTFLDCRPEDMETSAIDLIIRLNKRYQSVRTHIVHLSAGSAIPSIREAKSMDLPLTVETCFHYLCLSSAEIPAGHPEFKCCPPIRTSENREKLWDALKEGIIDFVVSDHSPCGAELKCLDSGNIMDAWGGIGGLGLGLSLLWTEARKRGISLGKVVEWLSIKPAAHASLAHIKGSIEIGKDADFVVFDPHAEFLVTEEAINFRHKISPYLGARLMGRVEKTFIRGHIVWDRSRNGDCFTEEPHGKLL